MTDNDGRNYKAPNGAAIAGTVETIAGVAGAYVFGPDCDTDFEHDGSGTKVDWDGAKTLQVDDMVVFADEASGEAWLSCHLIPADHDPLPEGVLSAMREQLLVGQCLAAIDQVDAMLHQMREHNPTGPAHGHAKKLADDLRTAVAAHYARIKQMNADAMDVFAQPGSPIDG